MEFFSVDSKSSISQNDIIKLAWLFGNSKFLKTKSIESTFIGPRKTMVTPLGEYQQLLLYPHVSIYSINKLLKTAKVISSKNIGIILFSIIFFFGFGEEISWGQRIFNIETPNFFIENNLDNKLISLRKEKMGYKIPNGKLFNFVSCPNYLGEIIEWFGFFILVPML